MPAGERTSFTELARLKHRPVWHRKVRRFGDTAGAGYRFFRQARWQPVLDAGKATEGSLVAVRGEQILQ